MTSKKDEFELQPFFERRQILIAEWQKIESEFPRESDGTEELCEMLFNTSPKACSKCHSDYVVRVPNTRYIRCRVCYEKTSLTANTFFHNARRPKVWLGAIRLMELGFEFSAHMLSVIAKVAYATAWEIMKKIDEVLKKNLDAETFVISTKTFQMAYLKRSRETPAKEHPKSEQWVAEEEQRKSDKKRFPDCNEREQKILDAISWKTVTLEYLEGMLGLEASVISMHLMMLEMIGVVQRTEFDEFKIKTPADRIAEPNDHNKGMVKRFVKHLLTSKRGISRKYVHLYLARFWCIVDRERWKIGALLAECLTTTHDQITHTEKAPLLVPFPMLAA